MESSPQGFLLGIGKGTQSLVSGVVVGALSSTASIVGAASSGVASGVATGAATLSGNSEDFIKKREEKKRQQGRGPQGSEINLHFYLDIYYVTLF